MRTLLLVTDQITHTCKYALVHVVGIADLRFSVQLKLKQFSHWCWKSRNFDLLVALQLKSRNHQNHCDSSSGDHEMSPEFKLILSVVGKIFFFNFGPKC